MWKPLAEDFGIDDLNAIAAKLNRVPRQCVWHVSQEMGDHAVLGYRWTAIDVVQEAGPNSVTGVMSQLM